MADPTRALGDEARKKEDAWFRQQERELLEKARQEEQRRAWRARLAQIVGVSDEKFLDDLEEHGFAPETVPLLFVGPLFLVSWSDGEVTTPEREAILEIHVARRCRDPERFALDEVVKLTDGFSGAEIEQAVISGLYRAFDAERELDGMDILAAVKETTPLSRARAREIAALTAWASTNAKPAS